MTTTTAMVQHFVIDWWLIGFARICSMIALHAWALPIERRQFTFFLSSYYSMNWREIVSANKINDNGFVYLHRAVRRPTRVRFSSSFSKLIASHSIDATPQAISIHFRSILNRNIDIGTCVRREIVETRIMTVINLRLPWIIWIDLWLTMLHADLSPTCVLIRIARITVNALRAVAGAVFNWIFCTAWGSYTNDRTLIVHHIVTLTPSFDFVCFFFLLWPPSSPRFVCNACVRVRYTDHNCFRTLSVW